MNSLCAPVRKEVHNLLADNLLAWYDVNARKMPWRVGPCEMRSGQRPDPYHVWLSEIMLQQTQVQTVCNYFLKFIRLWPSLNDLAAADPEEILKAWAGLGYYSRSRNLKKCAEILRSKYGGKFPSNASELLKLPGIGEYTSAAIASIAFDESIPVIDGNVERVMTRMYAISTPVPKARNQIRTLLASIVPEQRSGDFAQATMDLGAMICRPKNPECHACPWRRECLANSGSRQSDFPVRKIKKKKPVRQGATFVALSATGKILLRKRPLNGMLAGMTETPSSEWSARKNGETGIDAAPFSANWCHAGKMQHIFTHFTLHLQVYCCYVPEPVNVEGRWVANNEAMKEALPNLTKKVLSLVFESHNPPVSFLEDAWRLKND